MANNEEYVSVPTRTIGELEEMLRHAMAPRVTYAPDDPEAMRLEAEAVKAHAIETARGILFKLGSGL